MIIKSGFRATMLFAIHMQAKPLLAQQQHIAIHGWQRTGLRPVYMRGGTGRLPRRDDAWDPNMYMFL